MSIRTEKVASVVQEALVRPLSALSSEILAGFITVTSVKMSPDMRIARVYLSVFGGKISPEEALRLIELRNKKIRHEVASNVQLRFAPELKFFLDDTLDAMERIDKLLKNVPKHDIDKSIDS